MESFVCTTHVEESYLLVICCGMLAISVIVQDLCRKICNTHAQAKTMKLPMLSLVRPIEVCVICDICCRLDGVVIV